MRSFGKYSIFFVVSVLLFTNTIFLSPKAQVQNKDDEVVGEEATELRRDVKLSISPSIINTTVDVYKEPKVKENLVIKLENFDAAQVVFEYMQTDKDRKIINPSGLFDKASEVKTKYGRDRKVDVELSIDATGFEDRTYFFILRVVLKNIRQISDSIKNDLKVDVPIILTVNKSEDSRHPVPKFSIEPRCEYCFDPNPYIYIDTEALNVSTKMIDYGGEVLISDLDNVILFRQGVTPVDGALKPGEKINKEVAISNKYLPKRYGFLPYFGKLKITMKSYINNERDVQTKDIYMWIIPYELLIIIVGSVLTLFLLIKLILYILKIRYSKDKHGLNNMNK